MRDEYPFHKPVQTFLRARAQDKTADGTLFLNPLLKAVREGYLHFDQGPITVPAADAAEASMTITDDSHYELFKLMGNSDRGQAGLDQMFLQIHSDQLGWDLMNREINCGTILGTGLQPFPLPSSLFVPRTQNLQFTFRNADAVNAQIMNLTMEGRAIFWQKYDTGRIRAGVESMLTGLEGKRSFPYFLTTNAASTVTVANTDTPFRASIPHNAHFQMFMISAVSDFPFEWTLIDSFQNQAWHNRISGIFGLSSANSVGTGRFPFHLSEPTLIGALSRVSLIFRSAQVPNNIHFTMSGRLIPTKQGVYA